MGEFLYLLKHEGRIERRCRIGKMFPFLFLYFVSESRPNRAQSRSVVIADNEEIIKIELYSLDSRPTRYDE